MSTSKIFLGTRLEFYPITEETDHIQDYYPSGQLRAEAYYYQQNFHHIADEPARIWYFEDGTIDEKQYWKFGKVHRIVGPAIIKYFPSGEIRHEVHVTNGYRHREDGPAYLLRYNDGKLTRTYEEYWLNGHEIGMHQIVAMMRESNYKTETLSQVLNEEKDVRIFKLLMNMFRSEINSSVIDNIEMFL